MNGSNHSVPSIKQFDSTVRVVDPVQTPKQERILKVLLIGDSAVGKSTLLRVASGASFLPDLKSTIGVDFDTVVVHNTCFQIWDTAGQERFRSVAKNFYRGAHVVFFVFDLTRSKTFDEMPSFFAEVIPSTPLASYYLIGNKLDLVSLPTSPRQVEFAQGQTLADSNNMMYYETSAKTGRDHIMEIFEHVADHHDGGIDPDKLPFLQLGQDAPVDVTIKRKNCC